MSASRCDELARRRSWKRAAHAVELEQLFLEYEIVLEELLSEASD